MYTQSGVSFRYYQKGCSDFNFAAAQLYFRAQSLVQQAVAAGALEMVIKEKGGADSLRSQAGFVNNSCGARTFAV